MTGAGLGAAGAAATIAAALSSTLGAGASDFREEEPPSSSSAAVASVTAPRPARPREEGVSSLDSFAAGCGRRAAAAREGGATRRGEGHFGQLLDDASGGATRWQTCFQEDLLHPSKATLVPGSPHMHLLLRHPMGESPRLAYHT